MSRAAIVLELPEPPRQGGGRSKHWQGSWAKLNAYKRDCWQAAIQQHTPSPDPPKAVKVHLHYRLHSRRDPSNLYGDFKVVGDSLKQVPASRDRLKWKQGVWLMRGFYVDDDQLVFGNVTQEICRTNRGLTLIIEPLDE